MVKPRNELSYGDANEQAVPGNFREKVSVEAKIDRLIEELIAKMVRDELTEQEAFEFRQLVAQRGRKMRRTVPYNVSRLSRSRLHA